MASITIPPQRQRLHRSELAVPATSERFFEKAARGDADVIFIDLEDAVAPSHKLPARKLAIAALNDLDWGNKTMLVRVNGLDTEWGYRDIVEVAEACPRLDLVLLPKAGGARDIEFVDTLLSGIERAINPGLVMLRISAYGQTGPYKDRPGYARIAHAFSGLSFLAREPGAKPVMPGSTSLADYFSGLYGALGVLLALRSRDKSGRGQFIDIGLYEPIFRIMDELAPSYGRTGFIRKPMGADTVNIVPHSHCQSSDGRWMAIACSSDKMFERLALTMGMPELSSDPRYKTMGERDKRRDEMNAMVTQWAGSLTAEEILKRCEAAEIACGPLYDIRDIFEDPQYQARGNIKQMEDGRVGTFHAPNVVPRLSETPGSLDNLGPALGAHNAEIYNELLDMSAADLAELRRAGVI